MPAVLLGGWFTSGIGWRWAFWMNLPLGAVAIVLAAVFLRVPATTGRLRLDVWGILTMAVAVTSVILMTSWGGTTYAWNSSVILGLGALTVVSVLGLVVAERRAPEPILPPHLFANRNFVVATLAGMFMGVAMFSMVSYLPTYLQMVIGVSASVSGLMMLPMMPGLIVMAAITGQLAAKTGRYKWMPIVGTAVIAVSLGLLATLTAASPILLILFYLLLAGVGVGFGQQILVVIVQNAFPDREVGTATAANNFFREIGASIGGAVVGAVFSSRLALLLAERLSSADAVDADSLTPAVLKSLPEAVRTVVVNAYNDALTPVFAMLVPLVLLGLAMSLLIQETPLRSSLDEDEAASASPGETGGTGPA